MNNTIWVNMFEKSCDLCGKNTNYTWKNKSLCKKCLKENLQEEIAYLRELANTYKRTYADIHITLLDIRRQERTMLKNIIDATQEMDVVIDEYGRIFDKGGLVNADTGHN